ncbi:MAG: hypothetical protein HY303_03460, partial [Candidatus Wallbacteria bacterium]|nr:hypothetical protein [Candidatus Wallbacteria bacterium]
EGQHLQAGLLYQRLERAREAEEAFRAAAEMLAAQGNLLGAAQLLETKLAAPEEALVLLASGWPASAQASKCLVERLNLLGRLRRHDEALRLLPRLAAEQLPPDRMCLLAESFSAIARAYPDREVRGRAADLTRVAAGKRLPEALPGETVGLVAAVSRLAPEDRLLARDAQRYIARSQRRLPSAMPLGASARKIVPVAEVRLSPAGEVQWQVAATAGDWLYAAGHNKARRIVLARMGPERALERLRWYKPLWDQELPILATPRHSGHPVLVWLWGGVSPGHLRDHPVQQFGDGTPAGSPAWLPGNTVALCYSDADIVWVLKRSRGSAPALASFTSAGELLKTLELGAVSESSFGPRGGAAVPMAAQSRHVFVATTRLLHQVFETGKPRTLELPGAIHGLALSPPNSRLRVAAVLDEGGVLFWPARVGETTVQGVFGERLYRPKAALLGDGSLIALTRKEGRLYDTGSGRVRLVSSFEGPGDDLLAVQPCRRPEEFVVVTREGLARTYRVTGR